MTQEETKKLRKIYSDTFSTESGQAVLEDLRKRFYWYDTTYSRNKGETQLNEGGRRVLLTIESVIKFREEKESE